jgi:hypothetical protein
LSSALRTVPSAKSGKNRNVNDTSSAKSKVATDIGSGRNNFADGTESKEKETDITVDKGRIKKIDNQATLGKREKDLSGSHVKEKHPSGDCNNNEENGEDACQKPKEDVPSISVSDVEIRLKNLEITPSETKNIEVKLKKLTVTLPEGELCERSPIGNEKCRRNNYSPYSVSFFYLFS